jgi:hypothetical protein
VSLARDVASAKDVSSAVSYVLRPPGWRADGASETTEDLRRQARGERSVIQASGG